MIRPVQATIDGVPHTIEPGETILSFLRRHRGQDCVPTLCDAPQLEPFGSCRVCCVEVAAEPGKPGRVAASCHTPITEGTDIRPDTPRIHRLRKNIIELVLTDHPLDCLTCEVNGNCELQTVAARVGVRGVRYPDGSDHLDRPKDRSHPYLVSDLAKCINCYRCVRACDEIQGEMVLSMFGRGFDSRIIKGLDTSFDDSPCVSCGACVQACPTAAISDTYESKALGASRTVRTICTYCGVGCNLDVAVRGSEVLSISAPVDAEVNPAHTCVKGRYAFGFYKHPDRLSSPMVRRNGNWDPVSWDEAYDIIVDRLTAIREEHGAHAIAGISSARCTNEENYLMQKFIRAVIGTNNIDCCARVCHAPTALGMQHSFGTGAATNSIRDLDDTSLILIVGANPTDAHPVTGAKIKQKVMKGTPLIVVDPRRTELARYATYHLALRPGTNVALLNMMSYYLVTDDLADWDFVNRRCEHIDSYVEKVRGLDMDALERVTGVPRELVRDAATAYARAPAAMSFHGLGVTEHSQGSKTVMLIANLAMLTGNIGRPGVGVNPLRGQNNVQGAADMGVQPHQGAGYLDVTLPESLAHYTEAYGREAPSDVGLKIPQMLAAARDGHLKALWLIGEDIVQTDPNSDAVKAALESLDFVVVQELFMTETARFADVILPGASFLEKSGTYTNSERRIQRVNAAVPPIPGTRTDGRILVEIMNRMGYDQLEYKPEAVLEEIARVVPFFRGVKWDELGENGKQWPVAEDGTDTQILHEQEFKRGKGALNFFDWQETPEVVRYRAQYPYILTTGRILEHYNCGAMTRRTSNRELVQEDLLAVHPDDAAKEGLRDGADACVESARGEVVLRVRITTEVRPGVLYTTFHFPDQIVNQVTSDEHDEESLCPEYKVTAVRLKAAVEAATT